MNGAKQAPSSHPPTKAPLVAIPTTRALRSFFANLVKLWYFQFLHRLPDQFYMKPSLKRSAVVICPSFRFELQTIGGHLEGWKAVRTQNLGNLGPFIDGSEEERRRVGRGISEASGRIFLNRWLGSSTFRELPLPALALKLGNHISGATKIVLSRD